MTTKIIFAVVVVLMIGMQAQKFIGKVAPEEAHRLVESGAKLVDVRTPGEYGSGHIKGAKNIPLQSLSARMSELGPKDTTLVIYCQSGMRSASAKRMLAAAGYSKVHDLGAMSRW